MKKKEIMEIIQDLNNFSQPRIKLEQYCIDATSAVDIIFFAGVEFNDITNKIIFDLGAGTGRLTLASTFLHPTCIFSMDIDPNALYVLKMNLLKLKPITPVHIICANIEFFPLRMERIDKTFQICTIMNPPFGVKKRHADRIFLQQAFSFSHVVYSMHLAGEKNHAFIKRYVEKLGWKIDYYFPHALIIEKTFDFHKLKSKKINVNVYRFIKSS
ncbi:MAG: METTL5 family protein [Promethearchaeota archaeon]